jgi:ABC-type ATPase involved in cell division
MGNHDSSSNASAIALLRTTLDEVFSDHRFFVRKSLSPCQVVHYVLTQIRQGERDIDRLKSSTLEKLEGDSRAHEHPTAREQRGSTSEYLALDSDDSKSPRADRDTGNE